MLYLYFLLNKQSIAGMGKGKDKTPRVRRRKTDAEKDATRRLKEAKRRKQEQKQLFSTHEESKAENDAEEESTAAEDNIKRISDARALRTLG